MDEEEKKGETGKIFFLVALIVLFIGFVFYRILTTKTQQVALTKPANAAQNQTADTTETDGSSVTVAWAPGAEREKTALDDDQNTGVPATSPSVFTTPKPPEPVIKPTPPKIKLAPDVNLPPKAAAPPLLPPPSHPVEIKVEGVVTGPDGFVMITEGQQTFFKRAGDSFTANYKILRLSENNIVVRHSITRVEHNKFVTRYEKELWPIGDAKIIEAPGAGIGGQAVMPQLRTMPVPAPAPGGSTLPGLPASPAQSSDNQNRPNVTPTIPPAVTR